MKILHILKQLLHILKLAPKKLHILKLRLQILKVSFANFESQICRFLKQLLQIYCLSGDHFFFFNTIGM